MLNDVVSYLKLHGINPSKKLGQNFLINPDICDKIVNTIPFDKSECIIEVGPGLGSLTDHLVPHAKNLILIELDKRLYEYVQKKFGKAENIQIINNDVLLVDLDKLCGSYVNPIIVSNLPYAISSLMLLNFIKSKKIKEMYVMLQKEMVERILAKNKTKKYNNFTVLINYYANIKKIIDVGKNNFYPVPAIDSIVIRLEKNQNLYSEEFDRFTRICFTSKRRTLVNNLKNYINREQLLSFLTANKLPLDVRAE
jgi:16S rRNA (adenine1518-N6/adenine1519-N6)-dimethyltransferase